KQPECALLDLVQIVIAQAEGCTDVQVTGPELGEPLSAIPQPSDKLGDRQVRARLQSGTKNAPRNRKPADERNELVSRLGLLGDSIRSGHPAKQVDGLVD